MRCSLPDRRDPSGIWPLQEEGSACSREDGVRLFRFLRFLQGLQNKITTNSSS
jgi:hypothetical protein